MILATNKSSMMLTVISHSPNNNSSASYTLLASCMHAGSRIVRLDRRRSSDSEGSDEWGFEVLARFEEHESMNYGSDVRPLVVGDAGGGEKEKRTVVSTSFYDRLMCVWRV